MPLTYTCSGLRSEASRAPKVPVAPVQPALDLGGTLLVHEHYLASAEAPCYLFHRKLRQLRCYASNSIARAEPTSSRRELHPTSAFHRALSHEQVPQTRLCSPPIQTRDISAPQICLKYLFPTPRLYRMRELFQSCSISGNRKRVKPSGLGGPARALY